MTKAKRGHGSRRGIYLCLCAGAALGFALSGRGSGGAAPTGTASTSQATPPDVASGSINPVSTRSVATSGEAPDAGSYGDPPTASGGAVTLNWTPPTENTNGTPRAILAGYDIHYGTASGDYAQLITVSNPGIATYVVDNLTPGTYYFSVAAVDSQGAESPLSSEVSATVN